MSNIDPLNPTLPTTRTQLTHKYRTLAPQLSTIPTPVRNAATNLDSTRVARGQDPLSGPDTIRAIAAAVSGRPITPAPERSSSPFDLLGNFAGDVRAIGSALPHLPGALINEVQELPRFYEGMQENGFWGAPGVRMLPGAFTLDAVADGRLGEQMVQHPGFTALDLIPFTKGAGNIPLGGGRTLGEATAATRPAQAILRPIENARAAIRATPTGQFFQSAFGEEARDTAALLNREDRTLAEAMSPGTPATHLTPARPAPDLSTTPYADNPMVDVARRTVEAREQYAHIAPERQAALTEAAETGAWTSIIDDLPDDEAAYLRFAKDTSEEMAAIARNSGELLDFKGELYDLQTGKALQRSGARVEYATSMQTIRQAIQEPATDPSTLVGLARTVAESDTLSAVRKTEVLRGVSHALDVAGYDGRTVRETLGLTGRNPATVSGPGAAAAIQDVVGLGKTAGTITEPQLLDWLKQHRRGPNTNPNIRLAIANIESGNYTAARQNVQAIVRAKNVPADLRADMAVLPEQISAIAEQRRFLARTDRYSDKVVDQLRKRVEAREARTVPARFQPAVQQRVREGLIAKYATEPDFPAIQRYIEEGQFSVSPTLKADAANLTREMSSTWRQLKDEGLDPVFIHHVSPSAARAIDYPKVPMAARTPSWARRRTMDYAPYAKNMSVALNHQALESLSRVGAESIADSITSMYGRSRFSLDPAVPGLDDVYRAKAEAQAASNPTLDVPARVDDLIRREWVEFDPNSLTPWRTPKGTSLTGNDPTYIPKPVAKVIEQTFSPKSYAIQGVMDPVMNLFRTSVLALAPRWHFNNFFGGGFMVAMEDPLIFTKLPKAIKMMRSGEARVGEEAISKQVLQRQGAIGTGAGSMPSAVREWSRSGRLPGARDRAVIQHSLYAGRTMRRIMDAGGTVIDKSYALNQIVDDMYRSAAYLQGYTKALRKGMKKVNLADEGIEGGKVMAREAAEEAGMGLATKIFQNWDRMTPFERNVMRYVFPFYGWVSHITKYALRYPVDHPIRAAVMGSFAMRELEDMQDRGLPESFLNMFFLGNTDDQGNQRAVSLGAINPFSSVGDSFTLAGLTGNLNPVMGSFLTAIGIDPMSGEAELYPDMTYDPNTGRYGVKTPGMFGSLAGSIAPQMQALLSLVGQNAKYRDLVKTNPDSAINMLRSQAGLPVVFRNLPLVETQMKSELTRQEAQTRTFTEGLRSGDLSGVQAAYPGLAPVLDQLRALDEAGQLDQYRLSAPTGAPSTSPGSMFYEALVARNLPSSDVQQLGGAYAVQAEVLDRKLPWQ